MVNTTKRTEPDNPSEHDERDKVQGTDESQSHMGAEESKVEPTNKPPTQELAEMTSKPGQASSPQDGDYSPADEITPG